MWGLEWGPRQKVAEWWAEGLLELWELVLVVWVLGLVCS